VRIDYRQDDTYKCAPDDSFSDEGWKTSFEYDESIRSLFPHDDRPVNDGIRASRITLIGVDGQNAGVQPTSMAMQIAREAGLDLVQVSGGNVPVVRMMDWSKAKYEQEKKDRKARKGKKDRTKEIRLSLKIADGDFRTKVRQASRFLDSGHAVRLTVLLRGREQGRPQEANDLLLRTVGELAGHGRPSGSASRNGRAVSMMMDPIGKD